MSDRGGVIDRAKAREEELLADALAAHGRKTAVVRESAKVCECGQRIPAARRKAVPGVQLCIDCQEFEEQRGKLKGRHASSN